MAPHFLSASNTIVHARLETGWVQPLQYYRISSCMDARRANLYGPSKSCTGPHWLTGLNSCRCREPAPSRTVQQVSTWSSDVAKNARDAWCHYSVPAKRYHTNYADSLHVSLKSNFWSISCAAVKLRSSCEKRHKRTARPTECCTVVAKIVLFYVCFSVLAANLFCLQMTKVD